MRFPRYEITVNDVDHLCDFGTSRIVDGAS
jgi:hypothetical protein